MADFIARSTVTRENLMHVWAHEDARWPTSKQRITYARGVLDGGTEAPVPQEVQEGHDVFKQRLPHPTTVPMHTHNLLTSKEPRLKRFPSGIGVEPDREASQAEAVGNALIDRTFAWKDCAELLQNESMAGLVIRPYAAAWMQSPELYDDVKERSIAPKYRRDISGRRTSDDAYDDRYLDTGASVKAYRGDLEAYLAKHTPVMCDVYSRLEALPINLRVEGQRLALDGMITKRSFTSLDLIKRKYIWKGMPRLLEAQQGGAAGGGEHTLYELFHCDDQGPYIAYSIDGERTQKISDDGQEIADAIVDLTQYGLESVPCTWGFGWNWSGVRDMDKRGVPFPWVFGPSWSGANTILSAITYRHWATGYLGPLIRMDTGIAQALKEAGIGHLETELNREFPLQIMKATTISGDIQWPVAPEAQRDAWQLIQALMGASSEESTPQGALGGAGPNSGFDRALTLRDALNAVAQIQDTLLEMTSFVGSTECQIVCALAQAAKKPVVLDYNSPVPQGGTIRSRLRVNPDLFDGNYEFHCEFPRKPGENLPQAQQWMEFWKNRGMDFLEFRELAFGDPAPSVMWARVLAEDYLMSDEGRADLYAGVADYASDQRMREIFALRAKGLTNQAGTPTAYGQGVPEPQALTGMNPNSSAQSALAGIMGGAMQTGAMTQAAAAGVGAEANPQAMGTARVA